VNRETKSAGRWAARAVRSPFPKGFEPSRMSLNPLVRVDTTLGVAVGHERDFGPGEGQCEAIACHSDHGTLANQRPAFFMHQAFQDFRPASDWAPGRPAGFSPCVPGRLQRISRSTSSHDPVCRVTVSPCSIVEMWLAPASKPPHTFRPRSDMDGYLTGSAPAGGSGLSWRFHGLWTGLSGLPTDRRTSSLRGRE
jgi:hypothetical protein